MDFIFSVLQGAFIPEVIIFVLLGVFLGVTVGAIPGLSGDMAIAVLLPFVYKVGPVPALGMLIGIYKGSMFGGSISAISFGIPGTPGAVVTVEDGYPAKKKGYPKKAMLTALYSSVTGDFFSTFLLIFLAVPLATIALKFGPSEFFALYVFAIIIISLLVQGGIKNGLVTSAIGLFVASIGMDPLIGSTRLIFGISRLRGGIPLIPFLIGLFAGSELMIQFAKEWYRIKRSRLKKIKELSGLSKGSGYDPSKDKMSFKVYLSTLKETMIGSTTGTFIGALPGAGSSLAAYVSYAAARRFSSHPEQFGKGTLGGVAAPEAANSATCGAGMIPLLAFGIPGTGTCALIGAALVMQGINPGPLVFQENKLVMFTLFVVILYASVMNLGIGYSLIPLYAKFSMIKPRFLFPSVFLFALLGTYATRNSVIDIWIFLSAGLLGILLRKGRFPLGPLVIAFIIGPGAEKNLRQALLMGRGEWSFLLKSPIAIVFYVISVVAIILLIRFQKKLVS